MSYSKSLLLSALVLGFAVSASAQSAVQTERSVTAYGTSEVKAQPDLATLTLTLTSKAATMSQALALNAAASKDLRDTLSNKFGIQKEDLRNNVNESDDVVYEKDQQPKVVGEIVQNTVTIRTTKLDSIGDLIDAVGKFPNAKAGYVSYGLKDSQPVKEKALEAAVINAQANAQALLTPLNKKVGGVLEVIESGAQAPVNRLAAAPASRMAGPGGSAPSTEVDSGEITVTASVTIIFEILQ